MAASHPMAPDRQPRAVTANPTAKGNCVRVRLSIGTLKEASMVAYFRESSRSRLRKVVISRRAREMRAGPILWRGFPRGQARGVLRKPDGRYGTAVGGTGNLTV